MEKKKTVMNFDTKFFKREAIIETAREYTDLFWILVDGSDESIFVSLTPKEGDAPEFLEDEFRNYALAMMKNLQLGR